MDENERIHGDEDYIAEQERVAAEEAAASGGQGGSDEADESERALAEADQAEAEDFELVVEDEVEDMEYVEADEEQPDL